MPLAISIALILAATAAAASKAPEGAAVVAPPGLPPLPVTSPPGAAGGRKRSGAGAGWSHLLRRLQVGKGKYWGLWEIFLCVVHLVHSIPFSLSCSIFITKSARRALAFAFPLARPSKTLRVPLSLTPWPAFFREPEACSTFAPEPGTRRTDASHLRPVHPHAAFPGRPHPDPCSLPPPGPPTPYPPAAGCVALPADMAASSSQPPANYPPPPSRHFRPDALTHNLFRP